MMNDRLAFLDRGRREFIVGASLIAAPALTAAVSSTPQPQSGDAVSVRAWGATGANDVADGSRLNRALAEAPLGSTLVFPPGIYRTAEPLIQRRQLNIWFEPGATVSGVMPDDRMDLWDVRVEEAVLGNHDVRRMRFDNLSLEVALGTRCNNTFNVENVHPQLANLAMLVMNSRIAGINDQRGAAVRLAGSATQLHTFLHNEIVNQIYLDGCADACRFIYNLVSGRKTAFVVDLAAGAFRTLIAHNVLVARDGALLVRNGSQIDFLYNQIEQTVSYGRNASLSCSSIAVSPKSYEARQISIVGNNFGGGDLVDVSVHLEGTASGVADLFFDGNSFGATAIGQDIRISDAQVRGTRIGPNNMVRGERSAAQFTAYPAVATNQLDPARLLTVMDTGSETYGVRKPADGLHLGTGWTSDDLHFWKTLDEELFFSGALHVGATDRNTVIGVLPSGFRPASDTIVLVPTDKGEAAALTVGADGALSILKLPASSRLYFDGVRLAIKGRSSYDPGY